MWVGASSSQRAAGLELCRATSSSPDRCQPDLFTLEETRVRVTLQPFAIDRFEVTNARYRECVEAGACTVPDFSQCRYRSEPEPLRLARGHPLLRDRHPVVCVTYEQAERFCRWADGALPTEEEWERAAKGDDERVFPWGNAWDSNRLKWGDPDGFTAPVGQYPGGASPYGVEDMAGNVWEWAERLEGLGGPTDPALQVIRGGGFAAEAIAHRVTKRVPYDATRGYPNVGFRCVDRRPAE